MPKIVFIGEAWGANEEQFETAFVGAAGQELWRMLHDAGFPCEHLPYNFVSSYSMAKRWTQFPYPLLNVFNARPPDPENKNRVEFFYAHPKDKKPIDRDLPRRRINQAYHYVRAEYAAHVRELHKQLEALKPNLIVALGNTPLWALGFSPGIGKQRGSITECKWGKVLPVYHPAAVIRNWSFRIISVIDLMKAKREMEFPEVRVIERFIWTKPTIEDLYSWWEQYGRRSPLLAVDIETLRKTQISEIGFAASSTQALHIPFLIEDPAGDPKYISYWPDVKTEVKAWEFVRKVCTSPNPKIGQNVIQYDAYWLLKELGIPLLNITEDTMTKAHAWQPEWDKNLGFLGSIFLDERSWKGIRKDVAKGED